ncbi:STAS domain-containing protein [Streptomyces sp. RFCAC02]|uniref:STAS domain-containing protein n=1 Tax=Streptomyces sp. RFCAC02 TaxID=2499143 RepID=UPI00143D6701|nr:STAS domain-containing protein [Streptomyces sp. RFCAC02]
MVGSRPEGDWTVVVARGEFDIETRELLHRELSGGLRDAARGVVLDLAGVTFWDCSSLNVLLAARRAASREGKTVTIRVAGPSAHRILELTGALPLLAAPDYRIHRPAARLAAAAG